MPILLLIIGAVFLVSGIRGTQNDLFALLKGDFTGPNNFLVWLLAFGFIGALTLIPGFKPVANAFLALAIIVIVLAHSGANGGGFIANFKAALDNASIQPAIPTTGAGSSAYTTALDAYNRGIGTASVTNGMGGPSIPFDYAAASGAF